jgi:hypothetical protein
MAIPTEFRAYVISVVIFAILFFALTIVSNNVVNSVTDVETFVPWINATTYFLYVMTGLVSSLIAKRRVIFNGAIAGILAAIVAIVIFGIAGDPFGNLAAIVNGGVLGGIGGACTLIWTGPKSKAD